jgi:hypothetical protein
MALLADPPPAIPFSDVFLTSHFVHHADARGGRSWRVRDGVDFLEIGSAEDLAGSDRSKPQH